MQEMMDFALWVLTRVPDFLMTEPISAFVGLWILLWIGELVARMMSVSR